MNQYDKKIFYTFLGALSIQTVLGITGYSFTLNFVEYIFYSIIIVTPVYLFFKYLRPKWLRIPITIIILLLLSFVGYYGFIFFAFTSSERTEIESWKVNNYKITLTRNLDWAGPTYYKYELKKRSMYVFEKTVGRNHPGTSLSDTCFVDFNDYIFNKCSLTMEQK